MPWPRVSPAIFYLHAQQSQSPLATSAGLVALTGLMSPGIFAIGAFMWLPAVAKL